MPKSISTFIVTALSLGVFTSPSFALSSEEALSSQNPYLLQEVSADCAKTPLAQLCQGYLAASLNHLPEATELLGNWLKKPTHPELLPQTQAKLASVLILQGKYGPAVDLYRELLKLPLGENTRKGLENAIQMFGSLQDLALMQVKIQAETLPLTWDVHGSPNIKAKAQTGQAVNALLDTGANLSTVSESTAKSMGFKFLDKKVEVKDSMGQTVKAEMAVAKQLHLGKTTLENVPFLVLEDKALLIKDYQIKLILGLPVMMQLGRLEFYQRGELILGTTLTTTEPPNLFLEQFELAARTHLGDQPVDLLVDTGSRRSNLSEGFEKQAGTSWKNFKPEKTQDTRGGVGGMLTVDAIRLHNLSLTLANHPLYWKEIFVHNDKVAQGRLIGVLGVDVLRQQGAGFVLDFQQMRIDWLYNHSACFLSK